MVTKNGNDYTELIKTLEKSYGVGAIRHANHDSPLDIEIKAIPTGSLNLDLVTGIGGVPMGRITEIYGGESSGKSTLSIHIMAQAQKAGYDVAYIDAEHAMDPIYAAHCGLEIDNLLISQPDSAEQALNVVTKLVEDGRVRLIVVDSVHAMTPEEEISKDIGELTVALLPRLMSTSLRKLNSLVSKQNVALVFTNQIRDTINRYGAGETTPGGRALKFYASLRIELKHGQAIRDRDEIIGGTTRVRIVKNKCARPFRTTSFAIYFDEGISMESEVLDAAVDEGVIDKSGAFYYYGDQRLAQGRENARMALRNEPDLMDTVIARIRDERDNRRRMAA